MVVPASAPDTRRQQRLARDIQAAPGRLQSAGRTAERQEYGGRAAAEVAAAKRRAVPAPSQLVDVTVEAQPVYGRGRPSAHQPRPVTAMRYRLKTTVSPPTDRIAGREEAAGGCVWLTHVPTAGPLAHTARALLTLDQAQQGTEQNDGCRNAPVRVTSRFLKKPERLAALGLVL